MANSYIEIEFDVNYSFARYNKDSSNLNFDVRFSPMRHISQKPNIEAEFHVLHFQWYLSMTLARSPEPKISSPFKGVELR